MIEEKYIIVNKNTKEQYPFIFNKNGSRVKINNKTGFYTSIISAQKALDKFPVDIRKHFEITKNCAYKNLEENKETLLFNNQILNTDSELDFLNNITNYMVDAKIRLKELSNEISDIDKLIQDYNHLIENTNENLEIIILEFKQILIKRRLLKTKYYILDNLIKNDFCAASSFQSKRFKYQTKNFEIFNKYLKY